MQAAHRKTQRDKFNQILKAASYQPRSTQQDALQIVTSPLFTPGKSQQAQESTGDQRRACAGELMQESPQESPEEPKRAQESAEQPRRAQESAREGQESPGKARRAQGSTGEPRRVQNSPGEHRRTQGNSEEPRKGQESTREPRRAQESTQETPGEHKTATARRRERYFIMTS